MANYFENRDKLRDEINNCLQKQFNLDSTTATSYHYYYILSALVNDYLKNLYNYTTDTVIKNNYKKTIYFSLEFLLGRLFTSNLINLGIYKVCEEAFKEFHLTMNQLEEIESDAALGNGGLGRLAACFLDSGASLNYPIYGNTIRYKNGYFTQEIVDNKQVETREHWLDKPYPWENRREDLSIEINFYGYLENGVLKNPVTVKAVPYDIYVVGYKNNIVNHLRAWSAEESDKCLYKDTKYYEMLDLLTDRLYPDDSTDKGKDLRIQQEYFFVSAGVKSAIRAIKKENKDLHKFYDFYQFQINDTHPAMVIPELIRILVDEENFTFDEAFIITKKTCSYTNHTILQEALEKWNKYIFKNLLPRLFDIILELNRRFMADLINSNFQYDVTYKMSLIGQNNMRMANLAIIGSHSVNGVAKLHTKILEEELLVDFYRKYKEIFNNKTNGVTHRRWLLNANPLLSELVTSKIGDSWIKDFDNLSNFKQYNHDEDVINSFFEIKTKNKMELAAKIFEEQGVTVDYNSIFVVQVKRLHEYKRQLLNIFQVINLYLKLKKNANYYAKYYPHTYIIGAKAAPSYKMAKQIIELINNVSNVINNDPETNTKLKVVFVRNYNVSYAEKIIPATDISLQISTASKEASGTGNMKFMMNGALTIGTLDGANVEIFKYAKKGNYFKFGTTSLEFREITTHQSYFPAKIIEADIRLQKIFSFIRSLKPNPSYYDFILNNLLNSDYYLVLKDFDSYLKVHEKLNTIYSNREKWAEIAINNISSSYYFTSDRTIREYNKDIWKLKKIDLNSN
ncbi:MAG: glycogen/starch/alpha-glucan family phosphorylase [Acholeplasmatales bacterium]|nr:glycogen/starch/alpha-glucan family phosphorylase [Acholeplasmatales bacterium]